MTALCIGYALVAILLAIVATVLVARDADSPAPLRDLLLTYAVCAIWFAALAAFATYVVVSELRPIRDGSRDRRR